MQFGYSCTAIPTILTGCRPSEHGHLSFFSYAPERSPFKRLARWSWLFHPASFWDRGRVRSCLSKLVKRLYGFTGYFQLYRMPVSKLGMMDYCEKRDIFAAGGLAPCRNLRDAMDESGVACHMSDWRAGDAANFAAARAGVDAAAWRRMDIPALSGAGRQVPPLRVRESAVPVASREERRAAFRMRCRRGRRAGPSSGRRCRS